MNNQDDRNLLERMGAMDLKAERARHGEAAAAARASGFAVCPKCQCTQVSTGKRGFNWTAAIICGIVSVILFQAVGLLGFVIFGAIGSGKTVNRCPNCGHKWKP